MSSAAQDILMHIAIRLLVIAFILRHRGIARVLTESISICIRDGYATNHIDDGATSRVSKRGCGWSVPAYLAHRRYCIRRGKPAPKPLSLPHTEVHKSS